MSRSDAVSSSASSSASSASSASSSAAPLPLLFSLPRYSGTKAPATKAPCLWGTTGRQLRTVCRVRRRSATCQSGESSPHSKGFACTAASSVRVAPLQATIPTNMLQSHKPTATKKSYSGICPRNRPAWQAEEGENFVRCPRVFYNHAENEQTVIR